MLRRVFMWIAVGSLVGIGLTSAVLSSLTMFSNWGNGGWTFYSPYSQTTPSRFAIRLLEACNYAQLILVPTAALSSAAYILLVERTLRRNEPSRGFDVTPGGPGST